MRRFLYLLAARAPGKVFVLRCEDLLDEPAKHFAKSAKLIGQIAWP